MSTKKSPANRDNLLLARLSTDDLGHLWPRLQAVDLTAGQILHSPDQKQLYAYFPVSSIVVLIQLTEEGKTAKVGMIGHDGLVGIGELMTGSSPAAQAVVQTAGRAWRVRLDVLRTEFMRGTGVMNQCLRYAQLMMAHVAQLVVCNRHHRLEQQLCRWMLFSADLLPSHQIDCTQELIATMLGVRRQGVSEASARLQADGIITRQRGQITLIDRAQLERRACECYRHVCREKHRLFSRILTEPGVGLGMQPAAVPHDASDLRTAQAELALTNSNLVWWEQSVQGADSELSTSAYCNALLGFEPGEMTWSLNAWNDRVHPEDSPARERAKQAHIANETMLYESEYRMRHKEGHWVWIASRGKLMLGVDAQAPLRLVGTKMDITARKTAELALLALNRTDCLTGAASRRYFLEVAEMECTRAMRHNLPLALLSMDLDHFKRINDSHGHAVGDIVLKSFVDNLKNFLRATDLCGRVGGEEFCILLPQTDLEGAAALANRILAAVRATPVQLPSLVLHYTASAGVSSLCNLGQLGKNKSAITALLKSADNALYRAKSLGRNREELAVAPD